MNTHDNVSSEKTIVELRAIAKERGYTGYTKLIKDELIEFINSKTISKSHRKITPKLDPRSRQKPTVAPRVIAPKKETLRDLLPHDNNIKKTNVSIQKDFTPEFLSLKKTGIPIYIKKAQLGKPGKEGTVYLVINPELNKKYAMKTFRKKKSGNTLEKEAFYQYLAAKQGISPRIIEYNTEEKYIVMEILNQTLLDVVKKQEGVLSSDQQKQILDIYKRLDNIGIMLNDANPLNIMEKDGRFYAIDYGFAKFIDHKDFKDYPQPNMQLMPLGLLLWLKDRNSTKNWNIIRGAISPEVQLKMNVAEWP
jgi:predicted Ser/Thr protein kinase